MTNRPLLSDPRPRLRPGPIAMVMALVLLLAAMWQWSNVLLMGFGAILIALGGIAAALDRRYRRLAQRRASAAVPERRPEAVAEAVR